MGEILIPRRTKVEKGYELLADITVELAPVTNVDITGLNIGKGDEVVLVSSIIGTSQYKQYRLFVNNNTVETNYYVQLLQAFGNVVSAGRYNTSGMANTNDSYNSFAISNIKLTNAGYFTYQSHSVFDITTPASFGSRDVHNTSTFILASISQLTIVANVTSGIGIGSRFQLYKIN